MIDIDYDVARKALISAGREAPNEKRDTHSFFFFSFSEQIFAFFFFLDTQAYSARA